MSTRAVLTPESAQFKTTTIPALGQTSDASGGRRFLAYDAAADEGAYWTFIAPQGLTGTLTAIISYAMASATSGNVIWEATLEAITSGDALDTDAAESLATANVGTADAVPGTAGYMKQKSITLTNNDSIAAGDLVRLRIRRLGSNGSDTAAGDANLYAVEFRDAA